jgi:hypothetical protein
MRPRHRIGARRGGIGRALRPSRRRLAIEHLAARGIVMNIATQSDDETVTFHAARFDRAQGERESTR